MMSVLHVQCFLLKILKAFRLRNYLKNYKIEKDVARACQDDLGIDPKFKLLPCCSVFPSFRRVSRKKRSEILLEVSKSDGSLENFILKSILGFMGGVVLTYVCYMFLVFSLNFTLKRATYICMILGIVLSLGLAFSIRIRCTVFLCIPQLFSKRGRQALLAYAFILALSGPAKNTLRNVELMSESLACGQEQLKQAEQQLLQYIRAPNAALKKPLEKLLEYLYVATNGFKNFLEQLYKECYAVSKTFIHGYAWIYSISVLCNRKMGTPTERCYDLLAETVQACKSYVKETFPLNEELKRICRIGSFKDICGCSYQINEFCSVEDLPKPFLLKKIRKRLSDFKKRSENLFRMKVVIKENFLSSNRTPTPHEEYQGVATEIRQKTDQFLQYFDVMSVIFGIFILVLFVKVIIYRYKFLTEDEYDNRFITNDFENIDETRAEFRMETLLPLDTREKRKYIKVTSFRLVPSEKMRLFSSFVFLMFATFKIIIHMLTDSFLYWMLSNMRRHGRKLFFYFNRDEPKITITVIGNNIISGIFQNLTKAVKQYNIQKGLDPTPCLPDPVSPDWNRYYQILALILIGWFLALFEPYGLRLRHVVMVTYHPDRARERAVWLYNKLLSIRGRYIRSSRRQLRKKYRFKEAEFDKTVLFFKKKSPRCLLCKITLKEGEKVQCLTPLCIGLYCVHCYTLLKICPICSNPSDYGDYSDVSEEKDSSSEDYNSSSEQTFPLKRQLQTFHINYLTNKPYAPSEMINAVSHISNSNIINSKKEDSSNSRNIPFWKQKHSNIPSMSSTKVYYHFERRFHSENIFMLNEGLEKSDAFSAHSGKLKKLLHEMKLVSCIQAPKLKPKSFEFLRHNRNFSGRSRDTEQFISVTNYKMKRRFEYVHKTLKMTPEISEMKPNLNPFMSHDKKLGIKESFFVDGGANESEKTDFLILKNNETNGMTSEIDNTLILSENKCILTNESFDKFKTDLSNRTAWGTSDEGLPQKEKELKNMKENLLGNKNKFLQCLDVSLKKVQEKIVGDYPENRPGFRESHRGMHVAQEMIANEIEKSPKIPLKVENLDYSECSEPFFHRMKLRSLDPKESNFLDKETQTALNESSVSSGFQKPELFGSQPPGLPIGAVFESDCTKDSFGSSTSSRKSHGTTKDDKTIKPKFRLTEESSHFRKQKRMIHGSGEEFKARRRKSRQNIHRIKKKSYVSNKVALFKNKLSHIFQKNKRKELTSQESSETDVEDPPTSTVFLSDEEFEEISRRITQKNNAESAGRKMSQLSWAPDLLSDLPPSKMAEMNDSSDLDNV